MKNYVRAVFCLAVLPLILLICFNAKAEHFLGERLGAIILEKGGIESIEIPCKPRNGGKLIWISEDENVACVSDTGLVTAEGDGNTYVCVYEGEERLGRYEVVVHTLKTGVTLLCSDDLKLETGSVFDIEYSATGEDDGIRWTSDDDSVAKVDGDGRIYAVSEGHCRIQAMADGAVLTSLFVTVVDPASPTEVSIDTESITLTIGESLSVETEVLPETAPQGIVWTSLDESCVTVTEAGEVTAVGVGETTLRAESLADAAVFADIPVKVAAEVPTGLSAVKTVYTAAVGMCFEIDVDILPENADRDLEYLSSDPSVAEVSSLGIVTAVGKGKAVITVSAASDPDVQTAVGISVKYEYPESVSVTGVPEIVLTGGTCVLKASVEPDGCLDSVRWASSDEAIAVVDDDGRVRGISVGTAVITAETVYGAPLTASVEVAVCEASYTCEVPEITTAPDGIEANLKKIDAVYESACDALNDAVRAGYMGYAEAEKRVGILQRAFSMYRFPWMTEVYQKYWNKKNSAGGLKDYRPGVVYYGLPYVQYGTTQDFAPRCYDTAKAVEEGYYNLTDDDYYIMDARRRNDGIYVGCDCSSFVSIAQWGIESAHAFDTTLMIRKDTIYKTISWTNRMQPGDVLVKEGHCVLFLYYTDADCTQMMILEQGGGSVETQVHNTVTCSIADVAAYKDEGYRIRRQSNFANGDNK